MWHVMQTWAERHPNTLVLQVIMCWLLNIKSQWWEILLFHHRREKAIKVVPELLFFGAIKALCNLNYQWHHCNTLGSPPVGQLYCRLCKSSVASVYMKRNQPNCFLKEKGFRQKKHSSLILFPPFFPPLLLSVSSPLMGQLSPRDSLGSSADLCWICLRLRFKNTRPPTSQASSVWPWDDAPSQACICIINDQAGKSFMGQSVWGIMLMLLVPLQTLCEAFSCSIFFLSCCPTHYPEPMIQITLPLVSGLCLGQLPLQCVHSERLHVCHAGCGQVHAGKSADQPGTYHWR